MLRTGQRLRWRPVAGHPSITQAHLARSRAETSRGRGLQAVARRPVDRQSARLGRCLKPQDATVSVDRCESPISRPSTEPATGPAAGPGNPPGGALAIPRHGTTNLYAALDVASLEVITDLTARHRAAEFQRLSNLIHRQVADALAVNVIVDNCSTQKTAAVQRRLVHRPRLRPLQLVAQT